MVMFCKPHMLESERSPMSVTEQYDKFICDETYVLSAQLKVKTHGTIRFQFTGERANT
jgi:hypothetical protein